MVRADYNYFGDLREPLIAPIGAFAQIVFFSSKSANGSRRLQLFRRFARTANRVLPTPSVGVRGFVGKDLKSRALTIKVLEFASLDDNPLADLWVTPPGCGQVEYYSSCPRTRCRLSTGRYLLWNPTRAPRARLADRRSLLQTGAVSYKENASGWWPP